MYLACIPLALLRVCCTITPVIPAVGVVVSSRASYGPWLHARAMGGHVVSRDVHGARNASTFILHHGHVLENVISSAPLFTAPCTARTVTRTVDVSVAGNACVLEPTALMPATSAYEPSLKVRRTSRLDSLPLACASLLAYIIVLMVTGCAKVASIHEPTPSPLVAQAIPASLAEPCAACAPSNALSHE